MKKILVAILVAFSLAIGFLADLMPQSRRLNTGLTASMRTAQDFTKSDILAVRQFTVIYGKEEYHA